MNRREALSSLVAAATAAGIRDAKAQAIMLEGREQLVVSTPHAVTDAQKERLRRLWENGRITIREARALEALEAQQ